MSDRLSLTFRDWVSAAKLIPELTAWCKTMLLHGHTLIVEVVCAKTREQERLYHSCFRDLARDCLLGGIKDDEEAWKRATLYAFYLATKDDPDFAPDWKSRKPRMIPTLDGDGMLMINIESKGFTKNLAKAFITFLHSTGDERGVRWSRTSLGRDVPEEAFA